MKNTSDENADKKLITANRKFLEQEMIRMYTDTFFDFMNEITKQILYPISDRKDALQITEEVVKKWCNKNYDN